MYIGLVLGFINSTLLFPKILGKEVYGFCQFLIQMSGLIAVFSFWGWPQITIRFFSRFRDQAKQHNGFLGILMLAVSMGTLIITLLLILFKPQFIDWFSQNRPNPLIEEFYWALLVTFILTNINGIFSNYSIALQRPRVSVFLTEVFGRLLTLALILIYAYELITKDQFIAIYAFKLLPNAIALILFLFLIKELHLKANFNIIRQPVFKEMANYGGYSILSHIGSSLINRIDMIMIAAVLSWGEVGIYMVFYFLSTIIYLPHKGMASIIDPLIAEHWQKNERDAIARLYRRMATNNFIPAVLVFIGIIANLDNFILLMGEDYRPGQMVVVYLGLAQVISVMNGYNDLILIRSSLYRYDLLFRLIYAGVTVFTNYIMIRWLGLVGAAMATALTILISNLINQLFVFRKFQMHPFSKQMIYTALIGLAILLVSLAVPPFPGHFAWDIILRSGAMTLVFASLIIGFNIAPDITNLFYQILATIRKKLV